MAKRSVAIETEPPFGALRLPVMVENLRSAANQLSGNALSRRLMSVARRACLAGRSDPIDVDVFGLCKARLYPRSNRCEKRVFLGVNSWDLTERQALSTLMQSTPADRPFVFVDGGANVGMYSLFVASEARRLKRAARIVAIEPDTTNLGRLRFNLAASEAGEIHVAPFALGDSEKTGILLAEQSNRGEVRLARGDETAIGAVEVRVKTLPAILGEAGIDYIDALKLDIEGAEYPALNGLFSAAPEAMWPLMITLEVGKNDQLTEACHLCTDKGYVLTKRTSLNVILSQPNTAGSLKSQMESRS